jgi:hypothetical protein
MLTKSRSNRPTVWLAFKVISDLSVAIVDIFDIIASTKSEIQTVFLCSRQIESLILVWNVRSLAEDGALWRFSN